MLVLERRTGENIRIGDDIVVMVVQTQSGRVKLGIEAPRQVTIRRKELIFQKPPSRVRPELGPTR